MQNIDLICVGEAQRPVFCSRRCRIPEASGRFLPLPYYRTARSAAAGQKRQPAQIEKALEKEGKAILAAVRKGACLVALCVEGKQISSEELAALIERQALSGAGDMAFVIGSSHGLSPAVKAAANARISLGRITLPHQLARLVLAEQLYRACTINAGMKYHK